MALSAAEIVAFAPREANAPHTSLPPTAKIRVEKDGRPCDLALADVYAIRADAHYTHVHDGEREYFCNEAIGVLEAKLDAADFLRIHRSYIVRLDRVSKVKRVGEAAVAELECPVRCSIPVARAITASSKRASRRFPARAPRLFVQCVSLADAFRAPYGLLAPFLALWLGGD